MGKHTQVPRAFPISRHTSSSSSSSKPTSRASYPSVPRRKLTLNQFPEPMEDLRARSCPRELKTSAILVAGLPKMGVRLTPNGAGPGITRHWPLASACHTCTAPKSGAPNARSLPAEKKHRSHAYITPGVCQAPSDTTCVDPPGPASAASTLRNVVKIRSWWGVRGGGNRGVGQEDAEGPRSTQEKAQVQVQAQPPGAGR